MKIKNPKSRSDLAIKSNYRVLEVGGGHNPHPRANVVTDKFIDSNYHRNGDIKVLKGQEFIHADGEELPFGDQSFDYAICCHVLEHVDHPAKFLSEQTRVAGRGYLETPSLIGEYLIPKESHRWVLLEIDNQVVMYEKEKIGFNFSHDFGALFQEYLPKNSIGYKMMQRTHSGIEIVNYEWENEIDFLINPDSSYYLDFFTKPWSDATCNQVLGHRKMNSEASSSLRAILDIVRSVFKSKVLARGGN